jgi:aminomethyltransferase
MTKFTPLKAEHEALGAKMVDFAGWFMPIQYEGLTPEHTAVRTKAGIFDVSHMGEIMVSGPQALESLQWTTTNDVSKLKKGEAHYSLFPNESGGIVDDLIIYCVEPNSKYLLCVNASNTDKDFAFLQKNNKGAVLENVSSKWGQLAVQGPNAISIVKDVFKEDFSAVTYFTYKEANGCYVARTGYTGEDGVEIFVPWDKTVELWRSLIKAGAKPIGLGARDTLRTEMKYSLYGHEIDDETNPYEAGLGWVVKPQAKDFIGKAKILAYKEKGLKRKLIGFKTIEKGIPRQGYGLFSFDSREIGKVTSGTMSPTLNEFIGIGYVETEYSAEGTDIAVDIRGRKIKAKIVKTPFVNVKK